MASTAIAAQRTGTWTWVRAGLIGGVVAGLVFAMFEMIMAVEEPRGGRDVSLRPDDPSTW